VALLALSVPLYFAHQRPCLNAPPERINPNTASLASLVRLPNIGKARALDIMDYRDHHQQDEPAFQSPQGLEQIRGIGPKTVANIAPWLTFEEEPRMDTNEH
jgi:competence protein ComEA